MISPGLRFGRYEVGDRIGKGGFGVVHFARDVELGRQLAIKFLRPEYQSRPKVVQRFLQEARAAARIGHPGIVTVFECGQITGTGLRADGTAFIAMELLKGQSLAEMLDQSGRPPLTLSLSIGRQLATALASAHEAGIIHRDLKPDNVFLVPDPAVRGGVRVKILDFGVAKLAETGEGGVHTHSQVMLGTPRYMAPEQARSAASVDHRSDIYALGCILYELLCGRPPFSGDAGDVLTKHQSAPIPPLRKVAEHTPRELDRLISAMLAKAPEERPASMADVDATLGTCESLVPQRPPPDADAELTNELTLPVLHPEEPTLPTPRIVDPSLLITDVHLPRQLLFDSAPTRPHTAVSPPPGAAPLSPATAGPPSPAAAPLPRTPLPPHASSPSHAPPSPYAPRPPHAPPPHTYAPLPPPTPHASSPSPPSPPSPPRPARERTWLTASLVGAGLVFGGLVMFLALRSSDDKPPAEPPPSAADAALALALAPGDATAPPAPPDAGTSPPPSSPTTPDAQQESTVPSELEVECLRYQSNQMWADLDACADRLRLIHPTVAKQLKDRAVLETRAVPRIAAFEIALRDRNLKTARTQLEAISPQATAYAKLRQQYEQAESEAIRDLAARLDRVNDGDCKEYNQLLQQEKVSKPLRVANEAQRLVRCTPAASAPARCNHDELADKAREQFSLSQHAAALATYEAAWSCWPDPAYAEKAFITACNIPQVAKAKLFWRRLPPAMRQRALGVCVRNGITENVLNAP